MVSFCWSMAWSRRLDLLGRRILCEKALAAKMVSCELDSYALLLRTCICDSHPVTLDDLGLGVSDAELDNAHFHLLARRCSTDEDE